MIEPTLESEAGMPGVFQVEAPDVLPPVRGLQSVSIEVDCPDVPIPTAHARKQRAPAIGRPNGSASHDAASPVQLYGTPACHRHREEMTPGYARADSLRWDAGDV